VHLLWIGVDVFAIVNAIFVLVTLPELLGRHVSLGARRRNTAVLAIAVLIVVSIPGSLAFILVNVSPGGVFVRLSSAHFMNASGMDCYPSFAIIVAEPQLLSWVSSRWLALGNCCLKSL
jgi:hypothetical protein